MKDINEKIIKPINTDMEMNIDENQGICDICIEVHWCPMDCGNNDVCDNCDGVCKPWTR